MRFSLLLISLIWCFSANADTIDDMFSVKEIKSKQALVQGKVKDLKAGDFLYFARSPFRFKVESVKGSDVTIVLPERHDLAVGNTLVRNATPSMLKSIDTESKLKSALEE